MVGVIFRAAVVHCLTHFAGSITEEIASELGIVPVRIEPRAGAAPVAWLAETCNLPPGKQPVGS